MTSALPAPPRITPLVAGGAFLAITAALSLFAYRGTRVIGFDPHYYLEYTKQFRVEFPASFGTHWPFGFSLLGTGVSRLGVSAFAGLLAVSCLAWAATGALLWRPLLVAMERTDRAFALLLILATTAVAVIELGALRSEIAFTSLSLAAIVALAESDTMRAWVAAGAAVVLAFTVRYVGVLGLAWLGLWFLHREKGSWFRSEGLARVAVIAIAAAACGALMYWNVRTRGYASGAPRSAGPGIAGFGQTISDLGWGGVVSLSTIGVYYAFAAHSFHLLIGWAVVVLVFAFALQAWWRPTSRYSQPFALGAVVYLGGMIVFASQRNFDPLINGRTFIPALPFLFVLLVEKFRAHPRLLLAGGTLLWVVPSALVAARGVSPQLAPDFQPALRLITPRVERSDSIGVNMNAVGLSAWLDQRVARVDDSAAPLTQHRWLVLSADLGGGRAATPTWPPLTANLIRELNAGRDFERVLENAQLSVWQRREPSPAR